MDLKLSSKNWAVQKITVRSVLLVLFYVHMLLLFFQVPIRDIFFDITVWRDFGVVLICLIWFLYILIGGKVNKKFGKLEIGISLLLFYGLVNIVISISTGSTVIEAFTSFRNHFFPFLIYFPATYAFKNTRDQKKFIKFLLFIFTIYVSTPVFENVIKALGISLSILPWYHYAFTNSDRFEASDSGYIATDNSPILGLLGFPHYTVVPIIAIFALIYPFLFSFKSKNLSYTNSFILVKSPFLKYFYIIMLLFSVLLFQVRTHIITFFIVLFSFAPPHFKKTKYMILGGILLTLAFIFFSYLSGTANIFEQFFNGFVSKDEGIETSLSAILSLNDIFFVVKSPLFNILFGHGYSVIAATDFDIIANSKGWEIRIIYYTAIYGIFWLLLYIGLCKISFSFSQKCVKFFPVNSFEHNLARGYKIMLLVLIIDACHYMRMVTWPTLDMWIICMSILAVNFDKTTYAKNVMFNSRIS
jgi:hypothetical protein